MHKTAPVIPMSISQESSSSESHLTLTSVSSTSSTYAVSVNLMIPPGVVPSDDYGEVHTPERVSAYYNNGMTCDDDLVERADWRLHYRETIITEPQVTLRNRVSNQPYQAIRVNVPMFRGANAKWFMCPYRHNLIFIEGTHCAYTGTILPFCSCALCAGFQPWPFRSDTLWNDIRYVLIYTEA